MGEGFEVLETVAEDDWAGRFGFWVAVPSTELGDDPRGPGKCFRRMRVFLQRVLPSSSGRSAWRVSISGGGHAILASCPDVFQLFGPFVGKAFRWKAF